MHKIGARLPHLGSIPKEKLLPNVSDKLIAKRRLAKLVLWMKDAGVDE